MASDSGNGMPRRDRVDPAFDGHAERPFSAWTAEERLAWIWEAMQLLHAGRRHRAAEHRRPPA